jgi:DNA-binding response OmpR family regulator
MDLFPTDQTIPRRVLIADDEHMIADTLRTILNQNGFEAASAYGGQDAIDIACVWPPNILLTDVMMPGLNGVEAAIQIRKIIPTCGVLLFSGYAGAPSLQYEAQSLGYHFELLQKPVHPKELIERLRALHIGGE